MKDSFISKYKVAIVTDWLLSPGGADRFLLSILKVFPKADVYTAVYNEDSYQGEFKIPATVKTTFLQKLPFRKRLSRHYNALTPIAFEDIDLRGYDFVISLSAGPAKGVITGLDQKHIAIILTPPRYLWDGEQNFRSSRFRKVYALFSPFVASYLRLWDLSSVKRIDHLISISNFIQHKVQKIYKKESEVIYPGLDVDWFSPGSGDDFRDLNLPKKYFLVVSRLYDYKKIDLAVRAAIETGVNLVVVGEGPDRPYLERISQGRVNIKFVGWIPKDTLKYIYSDSQALLFCGVEDFGLIPLEAMAQGTPVLAYNFGGVTETVVAGKSGEFFDSLEGLVVLLKGFRKGKYDREVIVGRAKEFSEERFHENFIKFLEKTVGERKSD